MALLLAIPALRQRESSSLALYALSSSLMDDIVQHPAISSPSIQIRPRSRLKERHKHLFDSSRNNKSNNSTLLFDELALVACSTGVVCRKELFETYAAATFIHAKFPHMKRMADLAAGHGLLSWFLLALDDYENNDLTNHSTRKRRTVVCVDCRMPASAEVIATAMVDRFPQMKDRCSYVQSDLAAVDPHPSCVLTSVHACGILTDYLIEMAIATPGGGAPLAIVPCCHTVKEHKGYRPHVLSGMNAEEVAQMAEERKKKQENAKHEAIADVVDEVRCRTLQNAGYDVEEVLLPEAFTARNRMLLGEPSSATTGAAIMGKIQPRQGRIGKMPPLVRIPLADDHESVAYCHAVSGRARSETRFMEQVPRHFSPALDMSIWLTEEKGSTDNYWGVTAEMLQAFANQYCREHEKGEEIECTVELYGEVKTQSTTGRCSQLYRFKYKKPEGADLSVARVSRSTAKIIHDALRERIVDTFGDVIR
jgi:hypothetical protein